MLRVGTESRDISTPDVAPTAIQLDAGSAVIVIVAPFCTLNRSSIGIVARKAIGHVLMPSDIGLASAKVTSPTPFTSETSCGPPNTWDGNHPSSHTLLNFVTCSIPVVVIVKEMGPSRTGSSVTMTLNSPHPL